MKKIALWLMSTISALVLMFGYHTSTSTTAAAAGGTSSLAVPVTGGTAATPSGTTGRSSTSTSSSTVTGAVTDTRWGPVQVRLTVVNKKVTNVSVVQYPNSNGKDQEINANALPILIQETLKAQSAKIDMVSGATYTSTGYLTSLQSALDKAGL
jgi:uncharacterized protein with FMN-binding domain